MTAWRRLDVTVSALFGAAITLGFMAPAMAQNSDAPVDITAAPPPSADSVGPAQLRNFSLGGPSTRPSQPASSAPSTTSRPAPTQPSATSAPVTREPTPVVTTNADRTARPVPSTNSTPATASPLAATGRDTDLTVSQGSAAVAPAQDQADVQPITTTIPAPTSGPGISLMPWIAALIAAIAGAALLWWMRRQRQDRFNDPGRLAFAGPQPEADTAPPPRAPAPTPPPAPRPDPVPPRTPPRADDGLIVSRALRPMLRIEFQPDRLLINDKEVAIQFDMVLVNDGSAAARDVLVEAIMVTAHAAQDQQIAQFFQQPKGDGDRIAAIPPMGRIALKSIVRLPIDQVQRFAVEDRELFVPLVAFNILSRSGAGDANTSVSFMVGRGTSDDSKLAPFLVETGPKIISGLSSRHHSNGLSR